MAENPQSHRRSGCGQPGQLQVIGVSFGRRLCPAELKYNSVARNYRSTPLGFPGSSHSFAFTLRVWFYYADLIANRLQIAVSVQNAKQPGPKASLFHLHLVHEGWCGGCGENTAGFAMRCSKNLGR